LSYFVKNLKCPRCNKIYPAEQINQLCSCGSPLLVKYDLDSLKNNISREEIKNRTGSLWRYKEFLPIKYERNIVTMGEGMTPLVPLNTLGLNLGFKNLFLKDEGIIPTGTFKARGAAVAVSKAKELGIKTIAMPTNGNAGGAWATYSARAGLKAYIVMPEDAPKITRNECAVAGAELYLVKGLISDAGKITARAVKKYGWFDASTLKEPYRIEGKKTMGLEIAEQFEWNVPDVIIYPTGGGVGIIGIYKALKELQKIGWIGGKLPRLVSVQSSGCAPIVKAWKEKKYETEYWNNSSTIAFGINVPKAIGDFLILESLYATNGCAIDVDDKDILDAQKNLSSKDGVFACPEGAATLSAAIKLKEMGWIQKDEKVLLLNTGTGLKYPDTIKIEAPLLEPDNDI